MQPAPDNPAGLVRTVVMAIVLLFVAGPAAQLVPAQAEQGEGNVRIDPLTRYIHISYAVPASAPDAVGIRCSWSPAGRGEWHPAKVTPLLSDTALDLVPADEWKRWTNEGRITERRASGLIRTVVFNPYPEAQSDGKVSIDFRVIVSDADGKSLARKETRIEADNSDVFYVEDWTRVFQRSAVALKSAGEDAAGKWELLEGLKESEGASFGSRLSCNSENAVPQLTYPLDLKGNFAIFVHGASGVELRLTGDERADRAWLGEPGRETLWRWTRMDRQHLVVKQGHAYTGRVSGRIDYVRFVPLSDELVAHLDAQFGQPDKFVAGYWEPYSWAFSDNVQSPLKHREPLSAFAEARISLVDTQLGRFGMKSVFETRLTDQLIYSTIGDPIGKVSRPTTDNVGRMQQYSNTLDATLRYCRELGLTAHANFGASNCYPGSPLQGDFSKQHPEWMRGHALRFEVPEVRQYVLSLYRESLEIGARGISIDFCRYPETVDAVETGNATMRDIRKLADEFGAKIGARVPVLVRFPGNGVRRSEFFDYRTWAKEELVDYLCPSNIQGRHMNIDVAPYLEAVKGTRCKLLPCVDALSWGLPFAGPFLWRVQKIYEAGCPGIYIYQADGRILSHPHERRVMRMLCSSNAVRRFWEDDAKQRPLRSKGIFITGAHELPGYHGWERIRIWTEGVPMGELEVYLDGRLVNRRDGPPYMVGTEDYESDKVISPGEHELKIRVRDGEGWLEQVFKITGA
ncbi:MAG TPA: hypothetical protein PL033_11450 [Candidatus Brocadiia bacterium]|nr:hypothetical protein [Candidatus Brocadiia bacterium]